ncbi:MAG TPA: hypothetical protein V6D08_19720 [Candidatus Obscuribacterales bacterium]
MGRDEEEIKEKLAELEASLLQESEAQHKLIVPAKSAELVSSGQGAVSVDDVKSDLYLIGGFALLLLGIFMVMHHVQVGTGVMSWFGFGGRGFGLIMIPLVLGIGFLIYDYKNRFGWVITAASLALVLFAVLSQLVMWFPHISLLGLLLMLLPFGAGGAFIARGIQSKKTK